MSQLPTGPSDSEPKWKEDISIAFAAARQVTSERRLSVFLAAVSGDTLRLIVSELEEFGEALTHATICVRVLLTGDSNIPSEEELDRWSSRVHLFLILESLERRGFIHVDHVGSGDSFFAEPIIRII